MRNAKLTVLMRKNKHSEMRLAMSLLRSGEKFAERA